MRSLAAPKFGNPSVYEAIEVAVPKITKPDEVLVKVYAAGISTGDTQFATGGPRFLVPMK
jgi:NADPH:quinone reductase-like Zn-dependent oxidoreductase